MPKLQVAKARSRVINFRLTEQEYAIIRSACLLDSGRNLSDFARNAAIDLARSRIAGSASLQDQLANLSEKMSRVDVILNELVSTLKTQRSRRKQRSRRAHGKPILADSDTTYN